LQGEELDKEEMKYLDELKKGEDNI
jgi:hypothetical protein